MSDQISLRPTSPIPTRPTQTSAPTSAPTDDQTPPPPDPSASMLASSEPSSGPSRTRTGEKAAKALVRRLRAEAKRESGVMEPSLAARSMWRTHVLLNEDLFPILIGGRSLLHHTVEAALTTVERRARSLTFKMEEGKGGGTIRGVSAILARIASITRKATVETPFVVDDPRLPASGDDVTLSAADWRAFGGIFLEKRKIWTSKVELQRSITPRQREQVCSVVLVLLALGESKTMSALEIGVLANAMGVGDFFGVRWAKYARDLARKALKRKSPAGKGKVEEGDERQIVE